MRVSNGDLCKIDIPNCMPSIMAIMAKRYNHDHYDHETNEYVSDGHRDSEVKDIPIGSHALVVDDNVTVRFRIANGDIFRVKRVLVNLGERGQVLLPAMHLQLVARGRYDDEVSQRRFGASDEARTSGDDVLCAR